MYNLLFRDAQWCDLGCRPGGHSAVCRHDWHAVDLLQTKLYVHAEVSVIWQCLLQTDELASQWPRWKCFTPRIGNTSRGLMCVFFTLVLHKSGRLQVGIRLICYDDSCLCWSYKKTSCTYCAGLMKSHNSPFKIIMKGILRATGVKYGLWGYC